MREIDNRAAVRVLLLTAILSILAGFKLAYLPGTGPFGVDGGFYVNVARNVEEGLGVKTSISLYHFGHLELPTRSRVIYPLWPLLLGYTARVIGLFRAVNYLPPFLYLCDLLLLYALTNRLAARMWPQLQWTVTPGHLLVVLMGVNANFFNATTFPYTEGLAFFCALAALLALDTAALHRPVLYGALSAIFAGLGILTRTQLVILGIAIVMTILWTSACNRRFALAAAFAAVYAVMIAYWYFAVYNVVSTPTIHLPLYDVWSRPPGLAAFVLERWQGIAASVAPFSPYSYFASFGPAFLLPLGALPIAIVRWWRRRPRVFCIPMEASLPAACTLVGLGTYAALNLYHHHPGFFIPWLFGFRHSLPMMFGVAVATVYLLGVHRVTRIAALICIGVTILLSLVALIGQITIPLPVSPTPAERQMFAWLDAQHPRPMVMTVMAQHVAVYTHAGIQWTDCSTPPETTRLMLAKLPIEYVIVYPRDRDCAFLNGLENQLEIRRTFGAPPATIYVLGPRRR